MGYQTEFYGSVTVEPPLNEHEISFLEDFAASRRMQRKSGPYFCAARDDYQDPDVTEYNRPPAEQPGLWCQWIPYDEGHGIIWDQNEKFYEADKWMKYIVEHFLKPRAVLQQRLDTDYFERNGFPVDPRFQHFTFDHVVNGEIEAQGEDREDHWVLVVKDNVVKVGSAVVTFGELSEI